MGRALVAIVLVTLVVGQISGCASCATPYDNCGPTFINPGCDECRVHERLGSILSPGGNYYWGASHSEYSTDEPELVDEETMPYYERDESDGPQPDELMLPDLGGPEVEDSEVLPEPKN